MKPALRFGAFELFPETDQLRKSGTHVRLSRQPLRALLLLASRPGAVVSREEIRSELWGSETFVDFNQGINAVIRQIRFALNDTARAPRYLETIPRRGYRFIAAVEPVMPERRETHRPGRTRMLMVLLVLAIAGGGTLTAMRLRTRNAERRTKD